MHRYSIIPYPKILEEKNGSFITQKLNIIAPDEDSHSLKSLETTLRNSLLFGDEKKIPLDFSTNLIPSEEKQILIQYSSISEHDSPESYRLSVFEDRIEIIAPTKGGVFYAFQTLLQIITFNELTKEISIPCCRIVDWPSFPIRGFTHDVGRNFISINRLKKQMLFFARYKINVFHWHLTDNPAFRIESRTFPVLNAPKYQRKTRDPGKYYTYDDMHEFIAFCKTLNITVIPEIDVPGHSKYFRRTFKTGMSSRKGKKILKRILEEFLSEFSQEEFPFIHIGSDETHIINPGQFIQFIANIVHQADREILMWNPGLKPPSNAILHNWGKYKQISQRYIDSNPYYLNNMELFSGIMQIFFSQPCSVVSNAHSNGLALGPILCLWPDVNVQEESTTERYNFLYPAIITFAERSWRGNKEKLPEYLGILLDSEIESYSKFKEFETRLLHHRDIISLTLFFPYVKQSQLKWKIFGPFSRETFQSSYEPPCQETLENLAEKDDTIQIFETRGATLNLANRNKTRSLFSDIKKGIAYGFTNIHSKKEQFCNVWIGFETPIRSNREYRGIPENQKWDPNGGEIWLNGLPLDPPYWENAGKFNHYRVPSWKWPHHEVQYIDEEFYWVRKPYRLHLKEGWNKVQVKIVKSYRRQNWTFTFIPLQFENDQVWEVQDLEYKS